MSEWRNLKKGEIISRGDEWFCEEDDAWYPVTYATIGEQFDGDGVFRTMRAEPAPATGGGEGG